MGNPVPKPEFKRVVDSKGKYRYMISGDCEICGKYFEKRKDKARYKSICQACAKKKGNEERAGSIGIRNGKVKKCVVCQSEYYVTPGRITSKYCGRKCYHEANKDRVPKGFINSPDNAGKKNGRYKDGKRVGEKAQQNTSKNKVRADVIKRDGNWCLICGKPPKGLHLHRVVYGSQGGKYEKGNCVQLCSDHHDLVHSSKRTYMPLLQEYLRSANERDSESEPIEPPIFWHDWIAKFNGDRL